eukprot:scaffold6854_cov118-Isochrysis_galbana.AAC.1
MHWAGKRGFLRFYKFFFCFCFIAPPPATLATSAMVMSLHPGLGGVCFIVSQRSFVASRPLLAGAGWCTAARLIHAQAHVSSRGARSHVWDVTYMWPHGTWLERIDAKACAPERNGLRHASAATPTNLPTLLRLTAAPPQSPLGRPQKSIPYSRLV